MDHVSTIRFKNPPHVNTVDWEDFQKRTELVFETLGNILGKTLGAYGAPTLISNYPHTFVTKDGYRIALNTVFSKEKGEAIDRVICGMAMDICTRLNFAVGDGTTTAIMATNEVYKSCCDYGLKKLGRRPKDILEAFREAKDDIVKEVERRSNFITEDEIPTIIRKIVNVSTNGNKEITDLIVQAYEEIGAPGVVIDSSDNSETYMEITDGFKTNVRVTNRIYTNTGKGTCDVNNLDVIIFSHRVERTCYNKIIVPLEEHCRASRRKLLCLAPYYDEDLLEKSITQRVRMEVEKEGEASLIIGAYLNRLADHKKSIEDLAMLLNTTIIDRDYENRIIEQTKEKYIADTVNVDYRGIPGLFIRTRDNKQAVSTKEDVENPEIDNFVVRIGYADSSSLGAKSSVFVCHQYNEDIYKQFLEDARLDVKEIIDKNATYGQYSREIQLAQERYMALHMKIATIYLGGESELSRNMLKDSVMDAIRAAESAYRYGYIHGCNLTTIQAIDYLLKTKTDMSETYENILKILLNGFRNVYGRILDNAFYEDRIDMKYLSDIVHAEGWNIKLSTKMHTLLTKYSERNLQGIVPLSKVIEEASEVIGLPFDLEKLEFSEDIINSVRTDTEVLTAVIDLLGILIAGNQVIMYEYGEV